jgi:hypothetical protein
LMYAFRIASRVAVLAVLGGVLMLGMCSGALAVGRPANSNHFTAVLNEATSNADSRRSVSFYDADNIAAGPLFSVFCGFENHGVSSNAYEDPSVISVDQSTGDVYFLGFDNINPANPTQYGVDNNGTTGTTADDDTIGDFDLYKIDFKTVLNNWKTNFQGKDARSLGGALALSGPAPNVPTPGATQTTPAITADILKDYITYGSLTPYSTQVMTDPTHLSPNGATDQSHSNAFVLNGAVTKIGEINRNRYSGTSNFFAPTLNVINSSTMFMIDDARQAQNTPPSTANDNDYRMIERKNILPGFATVSADVSGPNTGVDGGFNNGTTQSWESRRIGQALLDTDETTSGSLLSEMQSSAYYSNGTIKGIWVADRDRPAGGNNPVPDVESGDDIAFLQLDANNNSLGYRTFSSNNATKFDLDNDPGGTVHGPGHVGQLFTASNGDLIVVEEGFTDSITGTTPNGLPNREPAVIRGTVNYDNGGKIDITWGSKVFLTPDKNPGDTFKERGYWSAYDPATNRVYFTAPGTSTETPTFEMAYYVLDLNTGLTSSYLNVDDSVSLFFGGSNTDSGQKVVAFSLATGVAGDYNGDGIVNAADYTVWRDHLGQSTTLPNDSTPGTVTQADYDVWKANFGMTFPGSGAGSRGAGAVPEPGSLVLLAIGLIGLIVGRRRFGR